MLGAEISRIGTIELHVPCSMYCPGWRGPAGIRSAGQLRVGLLHKRERARKKTHQSVCGGGLGTLCALSGFCRLMQLLYRNTQEVTVPTTLRRILFCFRLESCLEVCGRRPILRVPATRLKRVCLQSADHGWSTVSAPPFHWNFCAFVSARVPV